MTDVVLVCGTGTEVGKTIVTAAVAALAHDRGERVAVLKPVQTGLDPDEPGDVEVVRALTGVEDVHELARLPEPLAPATAAARAGVAAPTVAETTDVVGRLAGAGSRDLVLVEGAGGLLVRLDAEGGTLADLALTLDAPVLVVCAAGLGTLNQVALTTEALRARRIDCAGVVVGAWPAAPDLACHTNLADLPGYAHAPLLGRLPAGAGALDRAAFLAAARDGLAPALGGQADLRPPDAPSPPDPTTETAP